MKKLTITDIMKATGLCRATVYRWARTCPGGENTKILGWRFPDTPETHAHFKQVMPHGLRSKNTQYTTLLQSIDVIGMDGGNKSDMVTAALTKYIAAFPGGPAPGHMNSIKTPGATERVQLTIPVSHVSTLRAMDAPISRIIELAFMYSRGELPAPVAPPLPVPQPQPVAPAMTTSQIEKQMLSYGFTTEQMEWLLEGEYEVSLYPAEVRTKAYELRGQILSQDPEQRKLQLDVIEELCKQAQSQPTAPVPAAPQPTVAPKDADIYAFFDQLADTEPVLTPEERQYAWEGFKKKCTGDVCIAEQKMMVGNWKNIARRDCKPAAPEEGV